MIGIFDQYEYFDGDKEEGSLMHGIIVIEIVCMNAFDFCNFIERG